MDVDCPVVVPYYGGKFTMSKRLIEMIPPHERYIEVFAGGASMFFRKKKVKWNVLNDLDNDIVNLYICVLKEFEELKLSRNKLQNVTIENFDFKELVNRYEPRKEDFWYLDPPYVVAEKKGYYRNIFNEQSHIALKICIDKIDKGNGQFMVSYDDEPEIKELYKNYNIKTISTKYAGTSPEKRKEIKTELVILNYEPKEQVQLF